MILCKPRAGFKQRRRHEIVCDLESTALTLFAERFDMNDYARIAPKMRLQFLAEFGNRLKRVNDGAGILLAEKRRHAPRIGAAVDDDVCFAFEQPLDVFVSVALGHLAGRLAARRFW